MKILRPWLFVLGIVVAALAVVLAGSTAARPQAASPRFAALAPAGAAAQGLAAASAAETKNGPEVITALKSDISAPLASYAPIGSKLGFVDPDLNNVLPLPGRGAGESLQAGRDLALQDSVIGANIPAPLNSFDGVGNLFGGWPPDTNGDVGPNHYVQWINLSFQIWDKNGNSLFGPAAGNTLWTGFGGICQTNNSGDPIVLYDQLADRWFMSQFALGFPNNFHQCIAVSQTGDPLGAWHRYDFLWSTTKMNDYPHFGVWPDGYYMAVNQFHGSTFAWQGQGVAVFERSQMLTGGVARMVKFDLFGTDPNLGGMIPADWDGATQPPAGAPNPFAEMDDDAFGAFPDQVQVWDFHVDWANTANSTFTHVVDLPVTAFDSQLSCGFSGRACIPQPSTSARLDAISDRLMHRLQYRNFGTHQSMVTNHTVDATGGNIAGVRWYELRNTGSGWTIHQQGTYAPDTNHRWMGSVAMNGQGEIALGYSTSSASVFPSVRYTGRVAADALGTMPQGEGILVAGTGSQTDTSFSRWGDYSMMSVDPVDDCTFWYTQEYVQTTGSNTWKTRIGSFRVTTCGGGGGTGTIQGTVTDSFTGLPITGTVVSTNTGLNDTTDGSGFYQITNVPVGTYDVTATASGYNPSTATGVSVTSGGTTTQDFQLTAVSTGCTVNCLRVSSIIMRSTATAVQARVTVVDENGNGVSGATVNATWDLPGGGTQTQSRATSTRGFANLRVTGGSGTYTVTVTDITLSGYTFDPDNSTELSDTITR